MNNSTAPTIKWSKSHVCFDIISAWVGYNLLFGNDVMENYFRNLLTTILNYYIRNTRRVRGLEKQKKKQLLYFF